MRCPCMVHGYRWLNAEMKLMIGRGELSADEQQLVAKELTAKLEHVREEAKSTSADSKGAKELQATLEKVCKATPFVREVTFAREIAELERSIAALTELECSKTPLPLAEVQKLNAKPRLLEKLAAMRAASRGWFADP